MKSLRILMVCLSAGVVLLGSPDARAMDPVPRGMLLASDGEIDDVFGGSVAIDGDTAVIGAPWDDDHGEFSGAAYVFTRAGNRWVEQAKLLPADGVPEGVFAYSVAIDGDTAVVGALRSGSGWGAAYVFVRQGGVWTEQAKLLPADGKPDAYLGHSVAIDGDTVVVGAPDWNFYRDPGSAYVFTRSGTAWSQQAELNVAGIRAGHKYGHEVVVDGDTAIVSAFGVGPDYQGAAYVFTRTGGAWTLQAALRSAPVAINDYFGFGLALEGDTAVIGAPRDETHGDRSGAVYVFSRIEGSWLQTAKLLPADGATPDWFGKIVSLDGDTLLIGAPYDDDNGWWSGSAYLFSRSRGVWTEQAKLLPKDGLPEEGFGFALALDGDTAIIGLPYEVGPGAAYVYGLWRSVQGGYLFRPL